MVIVSPCVVLSSLCPYVIRTFVTACTPGSVKLVGVIVESCHMEVYVVSWAISSHGGITRRLQTLPGRAYSQTR